MAQLSAVGRKILEKLQNSQNLLFQINLEHFGRKILEKLQNSQIGHSESIQTTLVGNIGKVAKQPKLAILN